MQRWCFPPQPWLAWREDTVNGSSWVRLNWRPWMMERCLGCLDESRRAWKLINVFFWWKTYLIWSRRNGSCYSNKGKGEKEVCNVFLEINCGFTACCKSAAIPAATYVTVELRCYVRKPVNAKIIEIFNSVSRKRSRLITKMISFFSSFEKDHKKDRGFSLLKCIHIMFPICSQNSTEFRSTNTFYRLLTHLSNSIRLDRLK